MQQREVSAMIGFLAAAVFVLARVTSGISLGGEFTGAFVMHFELAKAVASANGAQPP